jgi:DNA-directed RNA polymerase specialized sigma24 family protein
MTHEQTSLLKSLLRHLPSRWIAALDAWSYRIARQHAERRRRQGRTRANTGKMPHAVKP